MTNVQLDHSFKAQGRKGCAGQVSILVDTQELEEMLEARMKGEPQDATD